MASPAFRILLFAAQTMLACACLCPQSRAAVVWVEEYDIRLEEDSPWRNGPENGTVYLETFIAGGPHTRTFVTPYINSPDGYNGSASGYYSVDGDDGVIDDNGRFGGSYTGGVTKSPDGTTVSFRFDFTRNESGELPRSVGLVVTNAILNAFKPLGNRSVAAAFDGSGALISEWTIDDFPLTIVQAALEWRPYHTNGAQFVGLVSDVGIGSFTITGVSDVDHVQYSFERIPEPQVWMLGVLAAGWFGMVRRVCRVSV